VSGGRVEKKVASRQENVVLKAKVGAWWKGASQLRIKDFHVNLSYFLCVKL
jgi:hypothetical protein